MKKLSSLVAIATALFSLYANAQQPQQVLPASAVAAATISCMTTQAPKDWTIALAWIDRSTPNSLAVGNSISVNNSKELTALPTCDKKTQAVLISAFVQFIPEDQKNWKQLFFRAEPNGKYNVYTDVVLKKDKK